MRALEPQDWPDLSDAALDADRSWLAVAAARAVAAGRCAKDSTSRRCCAPASGTTQAARLDRELPTHLALPGGRAAVDYTQPVPLAEARAQAFYGLADTPRLAGGRVELRLALLSPAGRPVAITADLAGFWRGAWAEVRKDMRGRYPKHHWPDDPASATPQR